MMKWSTMFLPMEKEISKEVVSVSHRLMLQAGLIQQVMAGVYSYTPFGLRVIRKIEGVIREEMEKIDIHEMLMPCFQPIDLWNASGRMQKMQNVLYWGDTLHDEQNCVLGPTCEELVTSLVGKNLPSHKNLPMGVFQINTKFRNEPRPQFGLIRTREFIMKDAYTFHANQECLDATYNMVAAAYNTIFKRCGVTAAQVNADAGDMGGGESAEFVVGEGENQLEIGHIFKLGDKYTQTFRAEYQHANGRSPILMGCYGIGVGRLLAAIIEQNHDDCGIVWPFGVKPFTYIISVLDKTPEILDKLEKLTRHLSSQGATYLIDDRDVRPSQKFCDAELLGIDRINLGKKGCDKKDRKTGLVQTGAFDSIINFVGEGGCFG